MAGTFNGRSEVAMTKPRRRHENWPPASRVNLPAHPLDEVVGLSYISIEALLESLQKNVRSGDKVIVKRHPVDQTDKTTHLLNGIAGDPRFHITKASIHDVFKVCDGVIAVNSGVGFEALLAGLPVLAVGKSNYNLATTNVYSIDEMPHALECFLTDVSSEWRNRVVLSYFQDFSLDPRKCNDFMLRLENLFKGTSKNHMIT